MDALLPSRAGCLVNDRDATMADTDRLIKEWEASGNMAQMVAAGIARKIATGNMHRFEDLPQISALAAEWGVSERTVSAAKSILGSHGILALENRRYYVAYLGNPETSGATCKARKFTNRYSMASAQEIEKEAHMEEQAPPLAPMGPSQPDALRMTIIRRYWHLVLKFTPPYLSDSGNYEASWIGGSAVADTEAELLAKVLAVMGDCGGEGHLWVSESETRDPVNRDNVLLTQRLKCSFCDERERVITVYHPHPTIAEEESEQGNGHA